MVERSVRQDGDIAGRTETGDRGGGSPREVSGGCGDGGGCGRHPSRSPESPARDPPYIDSTDRLVMENKYAMNSLPERIMNREREH